MGWIDLSYGTNELHHGRVVEQPTAGTGVEPIIVMSCSMTTSATAVSVSISVAVVPHRATATKVFHGLADTFSSHLLKPTHSGVVDGNV